MNWDPYVEQNINFKREYENKDDRFAVAGENLPERIVPITAGHAPRELFRHTWYTMQDGTQFEATFHNKKAGPSPLVQGELEIPRRVKFV